MIRYLLLVILLSAVGGWVALRFDPAPVFTEGMVGQPEDLIPGQGPANPVDEVLEELLFRPLLKYNAAGEIEPDLAEGYTLSKDGRTYTVTLKESFWRDGRPVTAADVSFTFTRDPAFAEITIEQVGEREVSFKLGTPLSSFPDILTRPVAPAHFRQIGVEQLGSGDFFIAAVKQEGEIVKEMTLRSGNSSPIRALRFRFFNTEEDLRSAARAGEVSGLAAADFSDPSFELYQSPVYSNYFALFFNLNSRNSLVKDKNFRLAAAAKTPSFSAGAAVSGPLSGTWAQERVKAPAAPKKKFKGTLTVSVPAGGELAAAAGAVKEAWEALGISVLVESIPAGDLDRVLTERDFEALILGQKVPRDPDRYSLWHSSARGFPGQNISGYADPRSDRALEEARKVSSRSARGRHHLNFQKLFAENNPAVLLYHPYLSYWVNKKFTGPDLAPVFGPEERFWNFAVWDLAFKAR